MRYRAIEHQSQKYPVEALCRVFQVSRSGYYDWRLRQPSHRQGENQVLLTAIHRSHQAVKQCCGSPRMHRELLGQGYACGLNRVARLMHHEGLRRQVVGWSLGERLGTTLVVAALQQALDAQAGTLRLSHKPPKVNGRSPRLPICLDFGYTRTCAAHDFWLVRQPQGS